MIKHFFVRNRKLILVWGLIILAVCIGQYLGLDKRIMTFGVVIFGILTEAFVWILGIIGLVPVIGPIIVKVVTLPIIWLINGFAYVITLLALKKGAKIDILKSRALVISFIAGIIFGFILGKLL